MKHLFLTLILAGATAMFAAAAPSQLIRTNKNAPLLDDTTPPVVQCLNGMSVNINPGGETILWTDDFLVAAQDDVTPFNLLQFGVRLAGTGTGFPLDAAGNPISSLSITCVDLGTHSVELWARDQSGNSAYCVTELVIQDGFGICGGSPAATHDLYNAARTLRLAPNPAASDARITMPEIAPETGWSMQISDAQGRLIGNKTGRGAELDLSAQKLAPGLYWVRLSCEDGRNFAGKLNIEGF